MQRVQTHNKYAEKTMTEPEMLSVSRIVMLALQLWTIQITECEAQSGRSVCCEVFTVCREESEGSTWAGYS